MQHLIYVGLPDDGFLLWLDRCEVCTTNPIDSLNVFCSCVILLSTVYVNITNSPFPLSSVVAVLKVLYFLLHFNEIFAFVFSP
jgi:hypothetical protein